MYVDAAEGCNDIGFQLGSSAQGTAGIATRQWSIKVRTEILNPMILGKNNYPFIFLFF